MKYKKNFNAKEFCSERKFDAKENVMQKKNDTKIQENSFKAKRYFDKKDFNEK